MIFSTSQCSQKQKIFSDFFKTILLFPFFFYTDILYQGTAFEKKPQASGGSRIDDNLDVVSYIKEYLHLKRVSEGDITDSTSFQRNDEKLEEDCLEDKEDMQTDEKKDPPLHVKVVKEVGLDTGVWFQYCTEYRQLFIRILVYIIS